jgi:hypothetical protein
VAGVGGPGDVGGIADRAIAASAVWARAALPSAERYLVHHAPRGRVFAPADREQGLLLGDYLYASGLVRVCAVGDVDAIAALADLVSLAAHLRAEDRPLDGELWLATAHYLAGDRGGDLEAAREALRAGDGEPLLRLAAKDPAEIVQQHRRHMGDTA